MGPPDKQSARPAATGTSAGISRGAEIRGDEYPRSAREAMRLAWKAPGEIPSAKRSRVFLSSSGNVTYLPPPRLAYQLIEREDGFAVALVVPGIRSDDICHTRSYAEARAMLASYWHRFDALPILPEQRAGS